MAGFVASAEIDIAASPAAVWRALTDPERIKQYFLGATVETDWQPGSAITWSGEYNGHTYRDKGIVLEAQPEARLVITHFSPMSGQPDVPENYHTVTYQLTDKTGGTHLNLTQDNNASPEEVEHSRTTWKSMLEALKQFVENDKLATTGARTDHDEAIREVIGERVAALGDKDAVRLAAVYSPQVVKFDLAPPLQDTGAQVTDPAYWRPWLDSWTGPITLEVIHLEILAREDIAFCHSLNRMRGTKTDGGHQDLWYRATLGLRISGGTWKITHEHNSVPFYMDGSGRAATDLHPESGND